MAKKIHALIPSERDKDCTHELGFSWSGKVPCTGRKLCYMCGEEQPKPNEEFMSNDTINDNLSLTVINDNDGAQCGESYKNRCYVFQRTGPACQSSRALAMVRRANEWMMDRGYQGASSIELLDQAKKVCEYYQEHVKELVA